jgi:hypothetical protein
MSTPDQADPAHEPDDLDEVSTHDTLRQIKAGTLTGKSLSVPHRRACVDHLVLEGMSNTDIAAILSVGVRTVERDRQQLRKDHKLRVDPDLVDEVLGQLVREAELTIARLRRIACEKDVGPSERRQATFDAWRVRCELIERLQSVGYLPQAESRFKAQVSLSTAPPPSHDEVVKEMEALLRVCSLPKVAASLQAITGQQGPSGPESGQTSRTA